MLAESNMAWGKMANGLNLANKLTNSRNLKMHKLVYGGKKP